jgi:hypothetical protein
MKVQLWELNPGEQFTAPTDFPSVLFEVTDFIIGTRGKIESVICAIVGRMDNDRWVPLKRGIPIDCDPAAPIFPDCFG